MFDALSRWRQRRVLRRAAHSRRALAATPWRALPFLAIYDATTRRVRLREKVVLFLDAKGIVGARGHEVTPLQRVVIAIEACVLVLELDLAYYDGFENVIVYPGEFVPGWEWEDEAGVVHRNDDRSPARRCRVGRWCCRGPMSQPSADWETHRHEPRDPRVRAQDRHAQRRCRRLPAAARRHVAGRLAENADGGATTTSARAWTMGEDTTIDPYAAESPAEFFAVLSEVFFADPLLLRHEYPRVYEQCAAFYRQDPAARAARADLKLSARRSRGSYRRGPARRVDCSTARIQPDAADYDRTSPSRNRSEEVPR